MVFKVHYRIELAKTLSGHWYAVYEQKKGKEKFLGHFPSATTILEAYPQSKHLQRWIADQGWDEAQRKKREGGERGTLVHEGIAMLIGGHEIFEDRPFPGYNRKPTLDEWWRLTTFKRWYDKEKPKIIAVEVPVFSKKGKYAGTLDCIAEIDGKIYIIDWKTSASMYKHFPLQFAAYAKALEEITDLTVFATAMLQLGSSTKDGYTFKEFENWRDHYKVFQHVLKVWTYDYFDSVTTKKKTAPVLVVPTSLSL